MKWLRNFMYGRYGADQLNNFLFGLYIVLLVLSLFIPYVNILCIAVIIYSITRIMSKKYSQRRAENEWYLRHTQGIRKTINRYRNIIKYRKTHKYLKCPQCHQYLRVPKGKGLIAISCPKCHEQFDRKT